MRENINFNIAFDIHSQIILKVIRTGREPKTREITRLLNKKGVKYSASQYEEQKFKLRQMKAGGLTIDVNPVLSSFYNSLISIGNSKFDYQRKKQEAFFLLKYNQKASQNDLLTMEVLTGIFCSSFFIISEARKQNTDFTQLTGATWWKADISGALTGALMGIPGGAAGILGGAIVEGSIASATALLISWLNKSGGDTDEVK